MRIFDIGFYDGRDSRYYLERGFEVIAFEANPVLCQAGQRLFAADISSGNLQLHNVGIGVESGQHVDFFVHTEVDEWSTFKREAAINWGVGKSQVIQVPCITPKEMFSTFGCPDYLKADIEGFDIVVAEELQHLSIKPELVSFEGSNIHLLRSLVLAGYQSFKVVDQARVPLQVVTDSETAREFTFEGGTGPFGDDAEGEWLSFENACYLYNRFIEDPFSGSTPPGHWFDIHAATQPPILNRFQQRDYLRHLIDEVYLGHCGMQDAKFTPRCPALQDKLALGRMDEIESLHRQLREIQSSRAWKLALFFRQVYSPLRKLLSR
jgi:FkbM family methyltransferase